MGKPAIIIAHGCPDGIDCSYFTESMIAPNLTTNKLGEQSIELTDGTGSHRFYYGYNSVTNVIIVNDPDLVAIFFSWKHYRGGQGWHVYAPVSPGSEIWRRWYVRSLRAKRPDLFSRLMSVWQRRAPDFAKSPAN